MHYLSETARRGKTRDLHILISPLMLAMEMTEYRKHGKPAFHPSHTLWNPFSIPTLPRPRRRVGCLAATAKTSNNLNSSPQLRKGLVTDVPGPKCNGCPGTLTSQEGLVSLLGAERLRSHFVVAGAMGPALRAGNGPAEILSRLSRLFFSL